MKDFNKDDQNQTKDKTITIGNRTRCKDRQRDGSRMRSEYVQMRNREHSDIK